MAAWVYGMRMVRSTPTLDVLNSHKFTSQKTEATSSVASSLIYHRINGPHTGQSSQLLLDANEGNAQFLSNLAGAVVWHQLRNRSSHELRRAMIRVVGNAASRLVLAEPRPDAIGNLCLVTNQR